MSVHLERDYDNASQAEYEAKHGVASDGEEQHWLTAIVNRRLRKYDDTNVFSWQFRAQWQGTAVETWLDEESTGDDDSGIVRRYISKHSAAIAREVQRMLDAPKNAGVLFYSRFFTISNGSCELHDLVHEQFPGQQHEYDPFAEDDRDSDVEIDDGVVPLTVVPYFTDAKGHGKALHPQTQGMSERANGQAKKVLLKRGLDLGHKHSNALLHSL